ncbi:MAG: hypothetical protein JWP08_3276 [Bryobacterales bacterium]|nr:hypothetical protein [Bryobacterales bacterium]
MFEFLFKYPASVFSKGTFVLLGSWPKWVLVAGIVASAALLAWVIWRGSTRLARSVTKARAAVLWMLQSATIAVLLLRRWEPAISVTALRPQQNIVAVVLDDSNSMGVRDSGSTREQQAIELLNTRLLPELRKQYQVRLYRLDSSLKRIPDLQQLRASGTATQLGAGLRQLADEAATLPVGSVILLSDGADNSGGIGSETMAELRRRRLPVNTVGFGRETLAHDVEISEVELPSSALANSRLQAAVRIRQNGFDGKRATMVVTSGGNVVASRDVTLVDGGQQLENIEFDAGKSGVKDVEVKIQPLPGEENTANNRVTRVLSVDGTKRRILYVEGEPRWEYKFLRRAVEDDPALEVVSMLRTTQNKIYRQGISNVNELLDGFPLKPEDLFAYQGLILGSVESGFFTRTQQEAIREFVDRRGGGLLFLGGRSSLSDGDYNVPPFSELLPVKLPGRKNTFHRDLAAAELTEPGKKSLICRIENDAEKSADHWNVLPYLADYQDPGTPKAGAVVLAQTNVGGKRVPLLVTENYGRGRTGVFATGGSWRWRMQQPVADISQETFWRQLLRWTAGGTPSRVVASPSETELNDNGRIELRAEVRDKSYLPTSGADVQARIIEPDGSAETVPLRAQALSPGVYGASWTAPKNGSYVAEISAKSGETALGSDVTTFRREDGAAENFRREQNRELLQKLADQTGGHYYSGRDAKKLPSEISFSEAGITARENKDLWNMPAVFLILLGIRSTEWLLRRRWGVV